MIKNYLCKSCMHDGLCIYQKTVELFDKDGEYGMGIDMEILRCSSHVDNGEAEDK